MLLGKKFKRAKGSMITEVLITMLLIVIAMLAVIPMLSIGIKSGSISKNRSVEMLLAQERMESYSSESFADLESFLKSSIANYSSFKSSGTSYNLSAETVYINPVTGKKLFNVSIANKAGALRSGYKEIILKTSFSYLRGSNSNPLDDSIQVTINIVPTGQANLGSNPVRMTIVISRDEY